MRHGLILAVVSSLLTVQLAAGPLTITTGKVSADYRDMPLEFEIVGVPENMDVGLEAVPTGAAVATQIVERTSRGVRIAWMVSELKSGEEAMWKLGLLPKGSEKPREGVRVKQSGEHAVDVTIDGKEFTRLISAPDQFKPYLYPLVGPSGLPITRQYPMQEGVAGEDQDHKHHRSLWFNHGNVDGVDFWAEGKDKGRIEQVAVKSMESGPVFGRIVTANQWTTPRGDKLLDDLRTYTFYPLGRGEVLLDVTIRLSPAGQKPVVFGDTKEGSFGIRLAETMKETRGGKIVNSRGQKGMKEAWGKAAEWVDYYGPVGSETVGVAILDHPKSFRHPTTWHVRDYGLFAANPFGYRDFRFGNGDGKYTLEAGNSMELRYRIYLHRGTTEDARVADVYRAFAEPPPLHPKS